MDDSEGEFMIRLVMMLVGVSVLMGAGCPAPTPTPLRMDLGHASTDMRVPIDAPACPTTMALPTADNVCSGYFTQEGYACTVCVIAGCVDTIDSVYCVSKSCAADTRCASPSKLKKRAGGK